MARCPIQLEQGSLDLALCQSIVIKAVDEGREVQDLGDLFFEFEDVEVETTRAQLQDVGDFRCLANCQRNRMANFLPHAEGLERVHLQQSTPMPPGGGRSATLVLYTGEAVAGFFGHATGSGCWILTEYAWA